MNSSVQAQQFKGRPIGLFIFLLLAAAFDGADAVPTVTGQSKSPPPPRRPPPPPPAPKVQTGGSTTIPIGPVRLMGAGSFMQIKFLNTSGKPVVNGIDFPLYPASQPSGSAVLEYKVDFSEDFTYGKGGVLPGIMGGGDECPRGAAGSTCWSVQLAWQSDGAGKVIAHLPRSAQVSTLSTPTTVLGDGEAVALKGLAFRYKIGSWNSVKLRVQLNTPGYKDGILRVEVNGKEVLKLTDLVFRFFKDLGVDAVRMGIKYSGAVPPSPRGIALYATLSSVELRNVAFGKAAAQTAAVTQSLADDPLTDGVAAVGRKLLKKTPRARQVAAAQANTSDMVYIQPIESDKGKLKLKYPPPPPYPPSPPPPKSSPPPPKSSPPPPKSSPPPPKSSSPPPKSSPPPPKSLLPKSPPPTKSPPPKSPPPPIVFSSPPPPVPTPFKYVDLSVSQLRRAMQLTSIFENADINFQYSYCEDIGDGRGFTFGFTGFTTATGSGLEVVKAYLAAKPLNNTLTPYLATLIELEKSTSGVTSNLAGFCQAVRTEAKGLLFRGIQKNVQKRIVYEPSRRWGKLIGAQHALTKGQLYDAMVNHGEGPEDPFSIDYIILDTTAAVGGTPLTGVDEKVWLQTFLDVRRNKLRKFGDSAGLPRIRFYEQLAAAGNWKLQGPIYVDLVKQPTGWTIEDIYYGKFQIMNAQPDHKVTTIV